MTPDYNGNMLQFTEQQLHENILLKSAASFSSCLAHSTQILSCSCFAAFRSQRVPVFIEKIPYCLVGLKNTSTAPSTSLTYLRALLSV